MLHSTLKAINEGSFGEMVMQRLEKVMKIVTTLHYILDETVCINIMLEII